MEIRINKSLSVRKDNTTIENFLICRGQFLTDFDKRGLTVSCISASPVITDRIWCQKPSSPSVKCLKTDLEHSFPSYHKGPQRQKYV